MLLTNTKKYLIYITMKHLKKFNESKTFGSHSLIVGCSYKITFPNYDDYDEGLEDEVSNLEILSKVNIGYLVKDIDTGEEYLMRYKILDNCEIEMI